MGFSINQYQWRVQFSDQNKGEIHLNTSIYELDNLKFTWICGGCQFEI